MMTSRDRVIRTLNHESVDRVPRDLWPSSAVETNRGDELAEMLFRYPNDLQRPELRPPGGTRTRGTPGDVGQHTDAWGCVWDVTGPGTAPRLNRSPLDDPSQLAGYRPPAELLETVDLDQVNRSCDQTSCFVLAWSETRPFQRLQWLCGSQKAIAELAGGEKPVRDLLGVLHDFFCREIETWASTDVDGVMFSDHGDSPDALQMPPDAWRDLFRPLYRDYCEILHQKDKFVFLQCDGNLAEILADLVEIGVDAVHSSLLWTDFESLAERFRGQVTFWGDVAGADVLSRGTPDHVRAAVRRVRKALDFGHGGVIAQCPWGPDVPFENIAAWFEHWLVPLPVHV